MNGDNWYDKMRKDYLKSEGTCEGYQLQFLRHK